MTLRQFTIYDHPVDHPGHWVVREWLIGAGAGVVNPASVFRCDSLTAARDYVMSIDPQLVCLTRSPEDDPVIVETWT